MKRVSVDIGGTFTDCFVAWSGRYVEGKALTTHHNLALGFNESLDGCLRTAGRAGRHAALAGRFGALRDDARHECADRAQGATHRPAGHRGLQAHDPAVARPAATAKACPRSSRWTSRTRGDPPPIVPIPMIREVRERVDYLGKVFWRLDESDVRLRIRELVDMGAEALVVMFTNSVVNPAHELRVREIFLEEYPAHLMGAIPMLLSHQVAGRKGEYVRGTSTIIDAFLHQTMYHGLGTLELNLRAQGYGKPMLVNHNSGGMAQLNSTDALQTVHSGPVSGIAASEHLATAGGARQRRRDRHGRHQLRHRHRRPGRRQVLRLQPGHRPLAGQRADDAPGHARGRRRLDRALRPHVQDHRDRAEVRRLRSRAGLLRPRRPAADRDRCRPAARLSRSRRITRMAASRSIRSARARRSRSTSATSST